MEEANGVEKGSKTEEEESPGETGSESSSKKSKNKEEATHRVPHYKLFSFADPVDYFLMAVGSVAAVGNGVSIPLMTIIFGEVVNSFGQNSDNKHMINAVAKVSLKFLYLALGAGAAAFTQVASWMVTGERQAARIRGLYLKTLLRQEIGFFDEEANTGEIIGRMSGDTVLIQEAMGEKVGKFIQLIATFAGGFAIALSKGWLLTLIMLSSIPLLVFSGAVLSITVGKLASRGQSAYSLAAAVAEQTIGSIRTVASFTGEKQAIAKYDKLVKKAYKSGLQEGIAGGLGFGTVMSIVFCTYALAVWFGGKMILEKGYTGGDVINIVFAVLTGSMALGQASPCLGAFATGQAAAYKMFEVIDREPLIDAYDTSGKILEDIDGTIELRDIYFSYPTRMQQQIFSGFSLSIPSGTTTALVGESGSGKSTVISLVERFYDPQAGQVLIDGIDLREFQLKWIRKKIGLVSQEPVLFTSSVRDNIAYGKDDATIEEIRAAAHLSNAAKFIDKLPQGLETMVGEHGTQLSGGQKQRVAIARAILKDPRILLLDEATSALDTESERIVQEALDRMMVNRTTVIIAHRLSTIRNANTIAVIHHGKIAEKGSHCELTKDPNGAYSRLLRLQEISVASEGKEADDANHTELIANGLRLSSQPISSLHSVSRGSSGIGSSSPHSFTGRLGLQARLNIGEPNPHEEAAILKKKSCNFPCFRVAYLNKPEIPVLLLGTVAAAVNGVVLPIFGILLSSMIKTFYEPRDKLNKDTKFWAFVFIALAAVALLVYPLRSYFFSVAGCRLIQRIRLMCFKKVVYMEVSWFDDAKHSSGALGARLSTDAAALRSLVGDALGLVVQNIATAVAGLAIAFEANWQLALVLLVLFPLLGVNSFVQMRSMRGFSTNAKNLYEEASQVANDAVGSIRTVASFSAEERVMELYKKKCQGPIKTGIRQGVLGGIGFGTGLFLLFSVYACSFYAGARLVEQGKATFSDVFRVFFALTMAAVGIAQSSSLVPDMTKVRTAAYSIFEILDRKSTIDASDDSGMKIKDVKGEIEFRQVSFRYPARPDIQVFQDLCLSVRSGKTVALVGESGSGKSTIISLLQRFYDPNSGQILLDGIEIQKLQLKWLREQMGLVSQEPLLFNDTIRGNILYGKGDASESEIISSAELANAHSFICGLQQGYDTLVGERGVQLSGGQKQRVAIARAILKQPKILLLDEATSALDAESERVVQDSLDRAMVNRTTIVVAHQLSTIKGADLIAVVKNGAIVEEGNHDSLMNTKDGVYASLVALHFCSPPSQRA